MAEKIHKRTINLLPNKKESVLEQFLTWAMTVGRLLVIITETLALSVFFYRFVLDVKIIDLHDRIKADSAIVGAFKEDEDSFRNLQMRLALAKDYNSKKDKTLSLLQDMLNLGKNKITFKSLTITVDTMTIEAQSPSGGALNAFVNGLKQNPEIKDVSIGHVENSPSSGLVTIVVTATRTTNIQKLSIPAINQTVEVKQ